MRILVFTLALVLALMPSARAGIVVLDGGDPEIALGGYDPPLSPAQACASPDYQARLTGCTLLLAGEQLTTAQAAAAHHARGTARLIENDFTGALSDLDAALALDPLMAPALAARASILLRRKQYPSALAALDRALALEPGSAAIRTLRGHAHLAIGMLDEAIEDFQRSLQLERHAADAHYGTGLVQARRGEDKAARSAFTRALAIDHRHAGAYYQRGLLHMRQRSWMRAAGDFDHANSQWRIKL